MYLNTLEIFKVKEGRKKGFGFFHKDITHQDDSLDPVSSNYSDHQLLLSHQKIPSHRLLGSQYAEKYF